MKKLFTILLTTFALASFGQQGAGLPGGADEINTTYNFDVANGFTVEYRIYMHALQNHNAGVTKGAANQAGPIDTYITAAGQLSVFLGNGGNTGFLAVPGFSAGQWYHIAVTADPFSGMGEVFVDGVSAGTFAHTGLGNTGNPMIIGDRIDNATNSNANYDNVRVWSGIRTPAEILANKDVCLTGTETGLEVLYQFETGPYPTVVDLATGDGTQNGTFTGGAFATGFACTPLCIADQTITQADYSSVCSADTVVTLGSEIAVNYYLRDDSDDSVIDGPISGTGTDINFSTGVVSTTTTYNVYAEAGFDNALDFDEALSPNGENVQVTGHPMSGLTTFTCEFIANPEFVGVATHVNIWGGPSSQGFCEITSAGHIYIRDGSAGVNSVRSFAGAYPMDGQCHHIALVHDSGLPVGAQGAIYVDGVSVPLEFDNAHNAVPAINMVIGSQEPTSTSMDGSIGELRFWNTARTSVEINANLTPNSLTGAEAGLVALYTFDDGSGSSTVTDVTGNGFTGTLNNMDVNDSWVSTCVQCSLEMTDMLTITIDPISQQTITQADYSSVCSADTTIELSSSDLGLDYYLRDDADDSVIDGPITGTGGAINLSTGPVSSTTTYNVFATDGGNNGALDFDGTNDLVVTTNETTFDFGTGNFTWEVWIKPTTVAITQAIFSDFNGTASNSSGLFLSGNSVAAYVASNTVDISTGAAVSAGVWNHIALVRNGDNAEIFVNGVSQVSVSGWAAKNLNSAVNMEFGRQSTSNNFYYNGQMDDARFWNVARTPSEILADMNSCLIGSESGLVAFYDFGEGTGTTVNDLAGGDNTGTLTNMDPSTDWVAGVSCGSCDLEMTDMLTITIDPISQQTLLEADWAVCDAQTDSLITLNGTQTGVDYYLRDDADDSVIDGPVAGSGGTINFNTGAISTSTTFNVLAEAGPSGDGNALDFDGTNDWVNIGDFPEYDSPVFTIEAWVNPANDGVASGPQTVFSKRICGATGYTLYWVNNQWQLWRGCSQMIIVPGTFGVWTHVACQYDGASFKLFLNGVQAGPTVTQPYTPGSAGFPLGIGNQTQGGLVFLFNGQIDEVSYWNTARIPAEIIADMTACHAGTEPGLVSYWDFNDAVGSGIATDKTGLHNGTLTNMDPATDWVTGVDQCGSPACELEMTDQLTVTINALPTVTAPADFAVCDAVGNVTLTGAGTADTYAWNNGVTDALAFNGTIGTTEYIVTGTTTLTGCQNTDTVDVTVNALPTVTAPSDITMCAGDTLLTGAGTADTYAWDNGVTDATTFTPPVTTTTYTVTGTITATGCQNTDVVDITVNPLPTVDAGVDIILCDTGLDTMLTGSGTADTYAWDNGITDATLFTPGLGTVTYTVTGTITATGCENTDDADVTVNPLPTVDAGLAVIECDNVNVTLTGSGTADTYAWDGGITDATPFLPTIGLTTYTVTGTITATGCENTDMVDVTGNQAPSIAIDSVHNALCFDSLNGQAFITITNGLAPYDYDWDHDGTGDNDDVQDEDSLGMGTWNVIVTDANGCMDNNSAVITEPTVLAVSVTSFNDPSACATPDGDIDVTVTGGTIGYAYDWDNDATGDFDDTEDLTGLLAGSYILVVQDTNGCTATVTQGLSDPAGPTVTIDGFMDNLCNGDTLGTIDAGITGGLAPFVIAWDNGDDTEDIINLGEGTYGITVTDDNGCIGTNAQTLTDPSAIIVAPTFTDVLCNADSTGTAVLNPTGGTGTLIEDWGTSNPTMLGAGWHYYDVTDDNACVLIDSVEIMEPAVLTSTELVTDITCYGLTDGQIDVTPAGGTGPYDVIFETTDTTTSYAGLSEGSYNYEIVDANGCSLDSSASIAEPAPLIISMTVTHEQSGGDGEVDLTISGGTPVITFDWDNDGTGDFDDTEDLSGLSDGTYIVVVQDASGCTATDTAVVDPTKLALGENEDFNFEVYPNPTRGMVSIKMNNTPDNALIRLIDVSGKTVYSSIANEQQIEIDLTSFEDGTYILSVATTEGKIVKRIVKQ